MNEFSLTKDNVTGMFADFLRVLLQVSITSNAEAAVHRCTVKKDVLNNFVDRTEKHPHKSFFFKKVLVVAMNFSKFFRTLFL